MSKSIEINSCTSCPHAKLSTWTRVLNPMTNIKVMQCDHKNMLNEPLESRRIPVDLFKGSHIPGNCPLPDSTDTFKEKLMLFAMQDAYSLPLNRGDRILYVQKWIDENLK